MKRLKDPIYGYIDIEDDIIENIIDTANFQRLRYVIQTSYSPLYASAVHNRFVHSLGVYHLGNLVSFSFLNSAKNFEGIDKTFIENYIKVFKYACLLHDVGHAPFSHTGEEFYLGADASRDELHTQIISLTKDESLDDEIKKKNYSAAPHELMSVVASLRLYSKLFADDYERSFFARCILGYPYVNYLDNNKKFLNCIISMLNSSIIDVDKLDYLIRDAYITGFDTVSIDYARLLRSVKVISADTTFKLIFTKAAISVIENVVFAHDAERKWIQNHPIVQYDAYLLKHAIETINSKYNLFSYEFLTEEGKEIDHGLRISLLNDSDVLFLMKNIPNDSLVKEYFSRRNRRHPLWKSEAEYKAIFSIGFNDNIFNTVENEFEELAKYLNFVNKSSEINESALKALEDDIQKLERLISSTPATENKLRKQLDIKNKHLKWILCLREFSEKQNIEFDFLIIKANQFNSGFGKIGFEKIEIEFPGLKSPCNFKKITNALTAAKSERDKFYYLFYRRKNKEIIAVTELASSLGQLAMQEAFNNK